MAPHEQSPYPPPVSPTRSHAVQALGALAALSVAGVVAARVKSGPLLFAAGALAASWWANRHRQRARRPLELMSQRAAEHVEQVVSPPVPPVSEPASVEAWLARQMAREQEAPVITLDLLESAAAPVAEAPAPLPRLEEESATLDFPPSAPVASVDLLPVFLPDPPPAAATRASFDASASPMIEPSPEVVPVYGLREEKPASAVPNSEGSPFFTDSAWLPKSTLVPPESKPSPDVLRALGGKAAATSIDSSWMLGIEPLPSWDEPVKESADQPAAAMDFMQTAPMGAVTETVPPSSPWGSPPVLEQQPVQPMFVPPLFQGAAFPDQIEVAVAPEPPPVVKAQDVWPQSAPSVSAVSASRRGPDSQSSATDAEVTWVSVPAASAFAGPVYPPAPNESEVKETPAALHPVFGAARGAPAMSAGSVPPPWKQVVAPEPTPPMRDPAPEAPLELSQPGEASFDDPLAALAVPQAGVSTSAATLPPLRPVAPVVEAEIVARPSGLGSASIIAPKTSTDEEMTGDTPAAVPLPPASLPTPDATLPPAPVVVPREQRARRTWRSWWRGE